MKPIETHKLVGWTYTAMMAVALILETIIALIDHRQTLQQWIINTSYYYTLPLLVVFWLTAKFRRLRILHGLVPLCLGPVLNDSLNDLPFDILAAAAGIAALFEYGYLNRFRSMKLVVIGSFVAVGVWLALFRDPHPQSTTFITIDLIFPIVIFFLVMYALLYNRIHEGYQPKKSPVILADKGLTAVEIWLIQQTLKGLTPKEMFFEIRNTFPEVQSLSTVYAYRTRAIEKMGFATIEDFWRDSGNLTLV